MIKRIDIFQLGYRARRVAFAGMLGGIILLYSSQCASSIALAHTDNEPMSPVTPRAVWVVLEGSEYSSPASPSTPAASQPLVCQSEKRQLAQATPTVTPTPPAPPSPQVVSSPEHPLPPVGKSAPIEIGVLHWYAFRDEGDAASIQVRADATPDQCLSFQVLTPEQLRLWQLGEEFKPVGQGTPNTILKADLFWTGSFVKSGVYYILVKRNPAISGECIYKLLVLGDDVSVFLPNQPTRQPGDER